MSGNKTEEERKEWCEEERNLRAELEELWQEESPATAKVTHVADEVDGELGTRPDSENSES